MDAFWGEPRDLLASRPPAVRSDPLRGRVLVGLRCACRRKTK